MKMLKKTVSILLALVLVLSVFAVVPMTASAEDNDEVTYYLVGDMNGWTITEENAETYALQPDPDAPGQYRLDYIFNSGAQFKIKDSKGNWYPDGSDNNYTVQKGGSFTIHFDPAGNKIGWHYGYFYLSLPTCERFFVPNSAWKTDNARFAVYYWNNTGSIWIDMTESMYKGIYKYDVPAGTWNKVIFCRMNPNAPVDNFNDDVRWNQSQDYDISNAGYFVMNESAMTGDIGVFQDYYVGLAGYNIGLSDQIALRFYVYQLGDYSYYDSGFSATYSYGSGDYVQEGDPLSDEYYVYDNNDEPYYAGTVYTVPVNARAMADEVTLKLYGQKYFEEQDPETGDVVDSRIDLIYLADYQYSVAKYAYDLVGLSDDYKTKYGKLVWNMLKYGDAVQDYFDYNTDNLATATSRLADAYSTETAENGDWYVENTESFEDAKKPSFSYAGYYGMRYKGMTLSATGQTTIRLYFTLQDDNGEYGTISLNNGVLNWNDSLVQGRGKYVEFNVSATQIFDQHNLRIGVYSDSFNVKDYYNYAMNSGNEKFKAVMQAMYNYYVCAKAAAANA